MTWIRIKKLLNDNITSALPQKNLNAPLRSIQKQSECKTFAFSDIAKETVNLQQPAVYIIARSRETTICLSIRRMSANTWILMIYTELLYKLQ